MKIKPVIIGAFAGTIVMLVIPLILARLNDYLTLASINLLSLSVLGLILCITGAVFFWYCTFLFVFHGKGTPAPIDPPKKLVSKGVYNYTRNPMYIGYVSFLTGEFLLFGRILLLFYAAVFFVFINAYIIFYEEPKLRKRFGKSYTDYVKKVPRWL
jgi:protein-S-isoprenylcysteine O-methyltransferase Ste14